MKRESTLGKVFNGLDRSTRVPFFFFLLSSLSSLFSLPIYERASRFFESARRRSALLTYTLFIAPVRSTIRNGSPIQLTLLQTRSLTNSTWLYLREMFSVRFVTRYARGKGEIKNSWKIFSENIAERSDVI